MDKMREEFEKWMVAYWHQPNLTIDKYGYENEIVSQQWEAWKQAWQASRKALVVELPVTVCRTHVFEIPYTHEVGMEHDEYFEVEDIHKALDAAGVTYK